MLRAMDSAVSGLRAHQNKLDVIGHNIANVNTFGFKAQSYSFKEAMYQTATQSTGGVQDADGGTTAAGSNAAQYGYGTLMGSITTDMASSTPTYVGGLNACINGQGFFITHAISSKTDLDLSDEDKVEEILKGQEFAYTRVGQFQLDSQGYLTDGTNFIYGFRPTDTGFDTDNLCALRVPSDLSNGFDDAALQAKSVKINELGEVTATVEDENGEAVQVSLGKIAIVTFQNQEGLAKSGGSYYAASIGDNTGHCSATIAGGSNAKLMTGYLEASNVDLAKEFSELITTQRGFQANTKIITVSDEILSDLISMKR